MITRMIKNEIVEKYNNGMKLILFIQKTYLNNQHFPRKINKKKENKEIHL